MNVRAAVPTRALLHPLAPSATALGAVRPRALEVPAVDEVEAPVLAHVHFLRCGVEAAVLLVGRLLYRFVAGLEWVFILRHPDLFVLGCLDWYLDWLRLRGNCLDQLDPLDGPNRYRLGLCEPELGHRGWRYGNWVLEETGFGLGDTVSRIHLGAGEHWVLVSIHSKSKYVDMFKRSLNLS